MLNIGFDARWHPDIVADITDTALFEREFRSAKYASVRRGRFGTIVLSDVLEHLLDLVSAMTNLLELLAEGGELRVTVSYDLSYGGWQDPTHLRAFNERSRLYCGAHGNALADKGYPKKSYAGCLAPSMRCRSSA